MLLLLVAATADRAGNPPPPTVSVRATATVHIEHAFIASQKQWEQVAPSRRRVIIERDKQGNLTLLRIVEFE
jgi:hypothetical protein